MKGTIHLQNQKYIFSVLPVAPFIHLICFSLSCSVLETLVVELSAFSEIEWNKIALVWRVLVLDR